MIWELLLGTVFTIACGTVASVAAVTGLRATLALLRTRGR